MIWVEIYFGSLIIFSEAEMNVRLSTLKGHSQLMHMRILYHFLAGLPDLHITRHARETDKEKRIRNI